MVVSCIGYVYSTRDQEIWESGLLGEGKRCRMRMSETWASASA